MQTLTPQHREAMMVKMIPFMIVHLHAIFRPFNHITSIKIHLYFSDGATKTQSLYKVT